MPTRPSSTSIPYLVQYNSQAQFVPDFAKSWQATSSDGKTWTFHTQPNAKWSDGKPLTAADVAFTLNTILKFQTGSTALGGRTSPDEERHGAEPTTWC